MSEPLEGCTIVVTRPSGQAGPLLKKLSDAGANAISFPLLAIEPVAPQILDDDDLEYIRHCDLAIFISRNAVIHGLPLIEQYGGLPESARLACIGRGTAAELEHRGVAVDLLPTSGANSEALLTALEANDVAGMKVLIVRGIGGRELLADTLRGRGAQVHYLETYRRTLPDSDPDILSRLWQGGGIDAMIVTSLAGLNNLHELVRDADMDDLKATRLYVVSMAMVELCSNLGYKLKPVLVKSPADDDIIAALEQNCAAHRRDEQDDQ